MKMFRKLFAACGMAACMAMAGCGSGGGVPADGTDGANSAREEYEAALERESSAAQAEHESEMAEKEGNTKPYGDNASAALNKGDGNGMPGLGDDGDGEDGSEAEGSDAEDPEGGAPDGGSSTEDAGGQDGGPGEGDGATDESGDDEEEDEAEPWDPLIELDGQACLTDYYDVPDWDGQPWAVLNGNTPYFTVPGEGEPDACESYGALDSLMRPGVMILCTDRTDGGQADYSAKPQNAADVPGWSDEAYAKRIAPVDAGRLTATGGTGDGRLWYMRRMAGTGSMALGRKSTIVCTQYMGICGMDALDALVDEYITKTGNKVLVRITPVFLEDELAARGVVYEAMSFGDSDEDIQEGRDLCFNMFCYNVQPGIDIDYGTGASSEAESSTEYLWTVNSLSWVLDSASMQCHVPGCAELAGNVTMGDQELYYGTAASLAKWSEEWDACSCMEEASKALRKAR